MTPPPPTLDRLIAFVDGQALYRAAKDAFGYNHPNYDVQKLTEQIARIYGWQLCKIYFYTGIPNPKESKEAKFWHQFWNAKLAVMGTRGIKIFTREIRYQNEKVKLKNSSIEVIRVGHEKGIDVRIALDVVRLALEKAYDVALIFSQDQDLSEAVDEVKMIAKNHGRWIKLYSAYPQYPLNKRGINGTNWHPMDKSFYDTCIDPADYRPKPSFNPVIS